MKSLIYGYGITGKSFERYLKKKRIAYDIFDRNIPQYCIKRDLNNYKNVLCSPGINSDEFDNLQASNNVLTDIDIFFEEDNSIKIGITGTNGKSTTCFHLAQLLKQEFGVNLIGNFGNPVLDDINNGNEYSIIELSSFQLHKMKKNKLDFGVLLNIEPDHLDYHNDFLSYKAAKERILSANKSIQENDPYILFEWITKRKCKKIKLKNLPYRYQFISKNIINDSKSTNTSSLKYAISKANMHFQDDYILICCGDPKKENFPKIEISGPEKILIYGNHAKQIDTCISHPNKYLFDDSNFLLEYLQNKSIFSNILFSPGFPSGLDYKNFEERGDEFNKLIHKLEK
jgi:UDP-N-acetylmuramoylalanine--D-glutamate ligase